MLMSCYVMTCYVILSCHAMSCYVTLCYVMLCYVMPWYVIFYVRLCRVCNFAISLFPCAIDGMSQELRRIETEWFAMTLVSRFETERFAKLPSRRHYQYFWSRFQAACNSACICLISAASCAAPWRFRYDRGTSAADRGGGAMVLAARATIRGLHHDTTHFALCGCGQIYLLSSASIAS